MAQVLPMPRGEAEDSKAWVCPSVGKGETARVSPKARYERERGRVEVTVGIFARLHTRPPYNTGS